MPPSGRFLHAQNRELPLIQKMIAEGNIGQARADSTFEYARSGGVKEPMTCSGASPSLNANKISELAGASKRLRALLVSPARLAYRWRVLGDASACAAALVPEASDNIPDIDGPMRPA